MIKVANLPTEQSESEIKIAIQFGNKHVLCKSKSVDGFNEKDAKEMFTILERKFIKEENTDL